MKTETKTEIHLIIGEGTPVHPLARIVIIGDVVAGPGLREHATQELIERIAAALAEHRSRNFDSRQVCADHGYQTFATSKSGYKCPVCDPKPEPAVVEEVVEMPEPEVPKAMPRTF